MSRYEDLSQTQACILNYNPSIDLSKYKIYGCKLLVVLHYHFSAINVYHQSIILCIGKN